MVKNTGNPYFEEAYFIVKKNYEQQTQADIVQEANRIVQKEVTSLYRNENLLRRKFLSFREVIKLFR